MSFISPDQDAAVQALLRDAIATLGVAYRTDLASCLARDAQALRDIHSTLTIEAFTEKLVDDFQQLVHDQFVDVSWPRCPHHPSHPLWLSDGVWRCTRDDVAVARFGELPADAAEGAVDRGSL